MKILNSLIVSTCIITSFGMNSSFATDNNIVNNQLSNQANQVNNQINTNVQPQVKTIKIGYDDVPLSNDGILDFRFKCYKDFFSKEYNKFASYDDLKFAPTYLKKLVESFNNEVNTKKYDDNESEILQIKEVFSDVLTEIINKKNNYDKTHNLTVEQLVEINDLLKKAKEKNEISNRINMTAETIRISNNSKAPRITMWDNIY